ncbi:MAG: nucleotidyltransferase domain-containing protein [Bacteroides sp.]|nr:nucleotidyltransferase domain-containing protein [Bacteroides sp.]MCM1390549.1 nucleotidyltransferase domain-containing protein [Bacteroides sp.]
MIRTRIIMLLKQSLASHLPKDAVAVLFGSQARGDYSENSDWDILILLNRHRRLTPIDLGNISYPIYELGAELGIDINPVIFTAEDWNRRRFTSFYKNVTNEGIKLWG